ncbi:MAG: hypothetical protein HOY71_50955 [Nonomuraea sp.]|nr:hypothetical protein [Nonomuraea sp.]
MERTAQRRLPARTNPSLEPLRVAQPAVPTLTDATVHNLIIVACPTMVTILGSNAVAKRVSLGSGGPDLADLGYDDLATLRRNLLRG